MSEPTATEILATFSASYHDLHATLEALRQETAAHREESRADRERIYGVLVGLSDRIDTDWTAMSAKVDQVWRALDELKGSLIPGEELRKRLTELEQRLFDHEDRLKALEERG